MEKEKSNGLGLLLALEVLPDRGPMALETGPIVCVAGNVERLAPRRARGYFAIGIFHTKTAHNVGTLWRSAQNFGAAFIFTIGKRYQHQASDTTDAPRHVPLFHYDDFAHFNDNRPHDCQLIGIEQSEGLSRSVSGFVHSERAIYLLGAEDAGLEAAVIERCQHILHIDTPFCLNVAVAGSIIMYDRSVKMSR